MNRLISKGIWSIYYQEEMTFPNLRFSRKENWSNALALKSKIVQAIFGETFILALLSSAVFGLQNLNSFNLFCSGDEKAFIRVT